LKFNEARLFCAKEAVERHLGTKELRRQISRKAYERREIANAQVSDMSAVPFSVFKSLMSFCQEELFSDRQNPRKLGLSKPSLTGVLFKISTFTLWGPFGGLYGIVLIRYTAFDTFVMQYCKWKIMFDIVLAV